MWGPVGSELVIWGNRKAPSLCPTTLSRSCGPPPSSRQYHRANTRTFVTHSATADRSSIFGSISCLGMAATSRPIDKIMAMVKMPLAAYPIILSAPWYPTLCKIAEATTSAPMTAKSSQSGPTERLLGNAAYTNPVASIAKIASQRGSLGVSGLVLELIRINTSTDCLPNPGHFVDHSDPWIH